MAPDELALIRGIYTNPDRTEGVVCETCTAPIAYPYTLCYQCNQHQYAGVPLATVVAPLTYALKNTQAMTDVYRYKDESLPPSVRNASLSRLGRLMYESMSRHLGCFRELSDAPLVIASVPSTSLQRKGSHPFDDIKSMFGDGFTHARVDYVGAGGARNDRRRLQPELFAVDDSEVRGAHVLLLDDSWVSGGHAQSVAAALRNAGAAQVDIVVLARVLDPNFTETAAYIRDRPPAPFDPNICPITGRPHD